MPALLKIVLCLLGVACTALALAGLLLLAGCGHTGMDSAARQQFQDEAVEVVWVEFLGVKDRKPPSIEWVEGKRLDCSNGHGWTYYYQDEPGQCVGGLFHNSDWRAEVAWYPGLVFSTSNLAHELCHAYEYHSGNRTGDYYHTGPCFTKGGLVEQANALLKERGL